MSKFIITYSKKIGKEEKEFETPELALEAITEKTVQIREEYPNGMAVIHKSDLEDMITQKKANEEYEADQLKIKQTEEK
jgi:hypothetical protein